jgi:hypothetical protein
LIAGFFWAEAIETPQSSEKQHATDTIIANRKTLILPIVSPPAENIRK